MGTRALVHIKDKGETILTIYRHFDGYPEALGEELREILLGKDIPEGYIGCGENHYHDMQCLAAYVVMRLKQCVGNVYIYPVDAKDVGEEYVYTIDDLGGKLRLYFEETRVEEIELEEY